MKRLSLFFKFFLSFILISLIVFLVSILVFLLIYSEITPLSLLQGGAGLKLLGSLSLIILLDIFLALLLARSIVLPLRELKEKINRVAKGNLDLKLQVKFGNEIGDLFKAFNLMVARLKQAYKRHKLVNQMKSDFITIAAHQLRTPLSGIKWSLKMLLDGDLGSLAKKQEELLEKSYRVNERMIRLVNALLDVSHLEEGKFGYQFVEQDLSEFIEEIVKENQKSFQAKRIKLIYLKPDKQLPKVKIDSERLRLAIQNLLDNARNYTLEGKVIISLKKEGDDNIKVSIKDTGVGIPKNQRGRIFSKFFRGSNVVKMETEGNGLGLYITRNIIQGHQGDIWFKSNPDGRGTTFYFTLPIAEKKS